MFLRTQSVALDKIALHHSCLCFATSAPFVLHRSPPPHSPAQYLNSFGFNSRTSLWFPAFRLPSCFPASAFPSCNRLSARIWAAMQFGWERPECRPIQPARGSRAFHALVPHALRAPSPPTAFAHRSILLCSRLGMDSTCRLPAAPALWRPWFSTATACHGEHASPWGEIAVPIMPQSSSRVHCCAYHISTRPRRVRSQAGLALPSPTPSPSPRPEPSGASAANPHTIALAASGAKRG
jgi:hypothetical protein